MSLSLIWPAGLAFGEILTSNDMEALDASQARAIDGVGGGTYAPSATIVINGAGLQVENLLIANLTVNGATQLGNQDTDALTVIATSTFSSPVTFQADVTFDTATFGGDVTLGSSSNFTAGRDVVLGGSASNDLTVNATATFNAPVTFDSVVTGDAQFNGHVQVGNTSADRLSIVSLLESVLGYADEGRVPFAWGGVLPDSNATITAGSGQVWRTNKNLTTSRTYTLSTTGAKAGDFLLFFSGSGNEGISDHTTIIAGSGSEQNSNVFNNHTNSQFALYVYDGSKWWLAISSTFI